MEHDGWTKGYHVGGKRGDRRCIVGSVHGYEEVCGDELEGGLTGTECDEKGKRS